MKDEPCFDCTAGWRLTFSVLSAVATVVAFSNDYFDGILGRDKTSVEIEKIEQEIAGYQKESETRITEALAKASESVSRAETLSQKLQPEIDNMLASTKLMQQNLELRSLAEDLKILRELRPLISIVDTSNESTAVENGVGRDVSAFVKNTGLQPLRITNAALVLSCEEGNSVTAGINVNWTLAPSDKVQLSAPRMVVTNDCTKCNLKILFKASADPVAFELVRLRYPSLLSDFKEHFEVNNSYNFAC